jgi:hypothetical protein
MAPGLGQLLPAETDIFSLLSFPRSPREAHPPSARRPDDGLTGVLGQGAQIGGLSNGGDLTFGRLPLLALALVLVSSLLLVGAVLPPGAVALTPVSPERFARFRQPLALVAIAILLPVALVALTTALS